VPAIVTDEEQGAAQASLASGRQRSPRNSKSQYLLRGLSRCPACGRRLAAQRKDPGTPKERRYYRCSRLNQIPGTTRTARGRTRVRAQDVEVLVVEHLAQCMENREEMRAAFDELRSTPERERAQWEAHLAALSAQEQRLERQRAGVYAMREAGETTAAEFAERRAAIEAELAAVRAEMAEVQGYLGQARDQEALWTSLERFCEEMAGRLRESEGPDRFPQRQRTVQDLVDAADVYPDKFDVHGVFGGSFTRRALLGLPDPLVAFLLVLVLEGSVGDAVGAPALAVRLNRAVVRLCPDLLGVLIRAPDRARDLGLVIRGHCSLRCRCAI
jgi:hypothetical protein